MFRILSLCTLIFLSNTPAFSDTVSKAQKMLNQLGYNAGTVDGAYGNKTHTALEAFYAAIGSSYDGNLDANELDDLDKAISQRANLEEPISLSTIYDLNAGNFDFRTILDFDEDSFLDFELYETFDVDADGNDDLIFGINVKDIKTELHRENTMAKPVVLFWNQNIKQYVWDEEFQEQLPSLYYPRRVKGYRDPTSKKSYLFITNTGLDGTHASNCGAKNVLLMYDPSNKKLDYTIPVDLNDYSHGLASIDMNNDGLLDHLVLNSPYIKGRECNNEKFTNQSYFLISTPDGEYEIEPVKLQLAASEINLHYDAAHAFIEDGKAFFVMGRGYEQSTEGGIDVYSLNDEFTLQRTAFIPVPKIMQKASYSDISSINGILLANAVDTSQNWMWRGRYIQFINMKDGNFIWNDKNFVQKKPAAQPNEKVDWCTSINFIEIDDSIIFVCNTRTDIYSGRPMFSVLRNGIFVPITINSNIKPQIGARHRGLRPIVNQNTVKLVSWDYTGDRTLPSGMVWEKIAINHIDPLQLLVTPKYRTTTYDRTELGLELRFQCLSKYFEENNLDNFPSEQVIERLARNLEGNDFYRSHRQIVKAGIPKDLMDKHKKALVRLINYEGSNEDYCKKPVVE